MARIRVAILGAGRIAQHMADTLVKMAADSRYADLKEEMGLDENARILLISTEGDTDPIMYRNVVWEGRSPKPEQEA